MISLQTGYIVRQWLWTCMWKRLNMALVPSTL